MKERTPIELVLAVWGYETSEYVNASGWRQTECPVHDDAHPSAGVSPDSTYFRCLACGFEGDVIKLTMEVEHLTFGKAVTWLEELVPPSDTTTSW